MIKCCIDDAWLSVTPKWRNFLHWWLLIFYLFMFHLLLSLNVRDQFHAWKVIREKLYLTYSILLLGIWLMLFVCIGTNGLTVNSQYWNFVTNWYYFIKKNVLHFAVVHFSLYLFMCLLHHCTAIIFLCLKCMLLNWVSVLAAKAVSLYSGMWQVFFPHYIPFYEFSQKNSAVSVGGVFTIDICWRCPLPDHAKIIKNQ